MTSPIKESPPASPTPAQRSVAEFLPSDQYSQYLLSSKTEMFAVCRGLADHVSQISMIFNEGRDMVLTSLISWGDNGLVFDFGASSEMNRKALKAEKVFCTAQLDRVEIQFILRSLSAIEADGRPAFHAPLPDSILRLQRREYFRLITPIAMPLKCKIPLIAENGSSTAIEAPVVDISLGGVCLAGLPMDMELDTDSELPGCSIVLPDAGTIFAALRLRWQIDTVTRSGIRAKRAGFEFANLPQAKTTLIQRYIIKTERDRKARESGRV